MAYNIGDRKRLRAEFTDLDGNPADPTSIIITVTKPSEAVVTFHYNVGGEPDTITTIGTGIWTALLDLDESGWWSWHCAGSGNVIAVEERTFQVLRQRKS